MRPRFRSFENYRLRVLLHAGGVTLAPPALPAPHPNPHSPLRRVEPQNTSRPLALAWRSWAQPDVGSLKPFAKELGASEGDWLVLVFGRAGTVDVRLVERSSSNTPNLAVLVQLLGLPQEVVADSKRALRAVGEVLGVDTSDEDALRFRIRASLQARRDQDILELADKVLLG